MSVGPGGSGAGAEIKICIISITAGAETMMTNYGTNWEHIL